MTSSPRRALWIPLLVIWGIFSCVMGVYESSAQGLRARKPLPKFLKTPALAERYLGTRSIEELLQFELAEPVCLQLLKRPAVPRFAREEALTKLAELRQSPRAVVALSLLETLDALPSDGASLTNDAKTSTDGGSALNDLALIMPQLEAEGWRSQRETLERLARDGKQSMTRRGAMAAWLIADGEPTKVWEFARSDSTHWVELLQSIPSLPGSYDREPLDSLIRPLLQGEVPREVREQAILALGQLGVRPQETFVLLAERIDAGYEVPACVEAMCNVAAEHWDGGRLPQVAQAVLSFLDQLPLDARADASSLRMVKLVRMISERLPSDDAKVLLKRLDRAALQKVAIHALEEKMAYDVTFIVTEARQPLQLVFENGDIMPHNLVVVSSAAAREEIGLAADRMQTEADALQRGYLPNSNAILRATRLLQPKQSDTLTFLAPDQPGVYAYLCTFPGHWSRMYGALLVVEDLDAYRAQHPELPTADEVLGIRKVEWQEPELSARLAELTESPSFENGRRYFERASCLSCHRMRGEGGRVGPELTQIREKHKTIDVLLHHVLVPSDKIEEAFAAVVVETKGGKVIRGVVVNQNETQVALMENPLMTCEPTIVLQSDIEDLTRSPVSPMPEKLLNTLVEPRDVRDLLVYILSGGDPSDAIYTKK